MGQGPRRKQCLPIRTSELRTIIAIQHHVPVSIRLIGTVYPCRQSHPTSSRRPLSSLKQKAMLSAGKQPPSGYRGNEQRLHGLCLQCRRPVSESWPPYQLRVADSGQCSPVTQTAAVAAPHVVQVVSPHYTRTKAWEHDRLTCLMPVRAQRCCYFPTWQRDRCRSP